LAQTAAETAGDAIRVGETGPARQQRATEADLERVLETGERLRIGADVDPTALRRVLAALRA